MRIVFPMLTTICVVMAGCRGGSSNPFHDSTPEITVQTKSGPKQCRFISLTINERYGWGGGNVLQIMPDEMTEEHSAYRRAQQNRSAKPSEPFLSQLGKILNTTHLADLAGHYTQARVADGGTTTVTLQLDVPGVGRSDYVITNLGMKAPAGFYTCMTSVQKLVNTAMPAWPAEPPAPASSFQGTSEGAHTGFGGKPTKK